MEGERRDEQRNTESSEELEKPKTVDFSKEAKDEGTLTARSKPGARGPS